MAIKVIKYDKSELIEKGEISFDSNIVAIAGINGSGKTILMKHLKTNFKKEWIEHIVLSEDIEEIEKNWKKILNNENYEKWKKLLNEIKNKKNSKEFRLKLDNFIWNEFKKKCSQLIGELKNKKKKREIYKIIENNKYKKIFFDNIMKLIHTQIHKYKKIFEEINEANKKLNINWSKFNKTKIQNINLNTDIKLNGQIILDTNNKPSILKTLHKKNIFFVRLINIIISQDQFTNFFENEPENIDEIQMKKINDWWKLYVSQEISIKIHFGYKNNVILYKITFWENKKCLKFDQLSSGTQNFIKIMGKLNKMNSQTIIQIDEPENGMHPIMQIKFRIFLRKLTEKHKVRFIIYTHSPYMIKDGAIKNGLYIMTRNNGKSKIWTQKDYEKNTNIKSFQLLENMGFESFKNNYQFNNTKKIIVVEGDTDIIYLKKMAKLLNENYNICRTVHNGGATDIILTKTILETLYSFEPNKIILSPDMDIETKNLKIYNKIKNSNYYPLGTKKRKEIEGMFNQKDKKYITNSSSDKNNKMNKAILFWQEIIQIDDLSQETINNFKEYFKKIKNVN